jgi:uncharacterized protein YndB with AHSA1/START domain
MNTPSHSVTVVRTLNASAENLYAAWTNPAYMRMWLAMFVHADVRVGGSYRLENLSGGSRDGFVGEYQILEPGRRILKTFSHTSTEPDTFVDEYLDVKLTPLAASVTELTLTNAWKGQGMSPDEIEGLKRGWWQWLDLLDALFCGIAA